MTRYQFALRRSDDSVALEMSLALADLAACWSKVGEIARSGNASDGRILVMDEAEEVVIFIGVASARALVARGR